MNIETNTLNFGSLKYIIGKNASLKIIDELKGANVQKPLLVADRGIEKSGILAKITEVLDSNKIEYKTFLDVQSDPGEDEILSGLEILKESKCDSVIGIGGGSSMDVAKCIRILATNDGSIFDYDNSPSGGKKFENKGLYLILIPTTSGTGSETTPYAVITSREDHRKATINDKLIVPDTALVDPMLTIGLPPHITASTGMDVLAHAIGAYTSGRVLSALGDTTISDTLSLKAIELVARNLRKAYASGTIYEARKNMAVASSIGGLVTSVGSDASHGLGHALGAIYKVPHGTACAIVMPYVLEYNMIVSPERFKNIAIAFGENVDGLSDIEAAKKAVLAVKSLMNDINIPKLKDYVGDFEKLDELCDAAVVEKCSIINPRPITFDIAKELYLKAYNME
ncbi:iron-containing alcohol dehydrogenase [Niallia circulans]|uniref:iron-containing alcohol dehydrogenase n=1 Tax=Niallia circulans TaxID=1397 RepID=UPI003511AFAE